MNRIKSVIFQKDLVIETYLVGYKNAGESIIFTILADNKVTYCGVIDCYEYNDLNKTIEILNKKGIKELDFICWTHPDEDHSIGIDKLITLYANEKTKVYLPEYINGSEYNYNDRVRSTFDLINQNVISNKRKKYIVRDVSDNLNLEYRRFDGGAKGVYEFTIKSIAPDSTLLRRNEFRDGFVKNDYSIGVIVNLGEFNILFSGDIENKTITKMLDYYFPEHIDFIKVPHHCSNSSDKLLSMLDSENKCEIACSTVFRSNKLPKQDIINKYKSYAREFYCTGAINSEDQHDYGVIYIKCDIIRKNTTTYLYGNSNRVFDMTGTE